LIRITACIGITAGLALWLLAPTALAQEERAFNLTPEKAQAVEKAVVYIHAEWKDSDGAIQDAWGSGFFVSDTEILTNYHVLSDGIRRPSMRITVRTHSGTYDTQRYEAYLGSVDEDNDIALLTVRNLPAGVMPLPVSSEEPAKNKPVYAFGFPMGAIFDPDPNGPGVALRRGYVSRVTHEGKTIEADMNIDHGMSGGPVTDGEGLLIGVVEAMGGSVDNPTAFAFVISARTVMEFLSTAGSEVVAVSPGSQSRPTDAVATGPTPGERRLRYFFSLGASLRMGTLVTAALRDRRQNAAAEDGAKAPDPQLVKVARTNLENVVAHLRDLKSPEALISQAEAATRSVDASDNMVQAAELAAELERACDEWMSSGATESLERINYDLGSWLIEMKLGLIVPAQDRERCNKFRIAAELQKAPETVVTLLAEVSAALAVMDQQRSVTGKEVIARRADALISIGFLGPAGSSTTTDKPERGTARSGRPGVNRIRIPRP
jgi:S1-C subfamily serine protease